MAPAALLKSQALRSGAVAHKARAPVRGMGRRCTMPVQATIAFVETVSLSEERVHTRQRVQEVQEVIALKIKEAAVEAPARRMQRDRVFMAACIKAAALQHILATTHIM